MRRRSRWSATARRTTPSWPASATQSTETEPHVDVVTTGPERAMLENMVALNRESLIDSVEKLTEAEARPRLVPSLTTPLDRKSVASGKSVAVSVDPGGHRIIKKKTTQ